jgi:hypothetical protein
MIKQRVFHPMLLVNPNKISFFWIHSFFKCDEFAQYWSDNYRTPLSARNRILASICPQLYGLYVVKLAIALILSGGVTVSEEDFYSFL